MMKSGASKLDQSAIRQFESEGKSASWISQKMQIPKKCVKSFMPIAAAKAKKKEAKNGDQGTGPANVELTPQQKGALTKKANAAAAAAEAEKEELAFE